MKKQTQLIERERSKEISRYFARKRFFDRHLKKDKTKQTKGEKWTKHYLIF